ncbi:uncharacterized protein SETTUDRAFT_33173 [Exserohilum turcica Et28A]|uniref:Uncharacterized protein n=1 Tax=Exserohilum turcicum (strain 28A) TaxID=671987 RepID=R0JSY3_EXST2|nr:uncharacterized protein SETTUDRAFT_33173 [Exserohilum turcica Et28A]EOA84168.1 hypothetical protein SETTUDRAFT_33173 [Exserohilum turcica Et28A]
MVAPRLIACTPTALLLACFPRHSPSLCAHVFVGHDAPATWAPFATFMARPYPSRRNNGTTQRQTATTLTVHASQYSGPTWIALALEPCLHANPYWLPYAAANIPSYPAFSRVRLICHVQKTSAPVNRKKNVAASLPFFPSPNPE